MLLVISFAGLVSCATPPDVPFCVPVDELSGYCFNTISDVEYQVDETHLFEDKAEPDSSKRMKTWVQLRDVSVIAPPYSYAKMKAYIQANCKRDSDCSKDLSRWQKRVKRAEQKMNSGKREP